MAFTDGSEAVILRFQSRLSAPFGLLDHNCPFISLPFPVSGWKTNISACRFTFSAHPSRRNAVHGASFVPCCFLFRKLCASSKIFETRRLSRAAFRAKESQCNDSWPNRPDAVLFPFILETIFRTSPLSRQSVKAFPSELALHARRERAILYAVQQQSPPCLPNWRQS